MTNVSNAIQKLDTVMADISKLPLAKAIEHPYVSTSLGLHFSGTNKEDVIARFKANCMILANDEMVKKNIVGSDTFTIINSLINVTRKGLSINPFDKECCIVKFGTTATVMEMVAAKKKLLVQSGAILNIDYLEVVYNCDKMEQDGLKFKHRMNFDRPSSARKIGVLMVATLPDGRKKYKYVHKADIEKRKNVIIEKTKRSCAKFNNTPEETKKKIEAASGMWNTWEDEMWQKTAVNIFSKDIPNIAPMLREDIEFDGSEEMDVTEDVTHETVSDEPINDPILLATAKEALKKDGVALNAGQIAKIESEIDEYNDERLQALIEFCNKPKPDPIPVAEVITPDPIEVKNENNQPPI